jgi:protein-tyrosine kinase
VPAIELAAMEAAGMIDLRQTRSRLSEELRLVQSQVLRVAFAPEPGQHGIGHGNLVMITSARPGEGKSFTSLNLAASIARQQDRDVLLVDVDSKAGSLGCLLGLQNRPGLLDLALQPDTNPAMYMVPTSLEKLHILPIGNPTERSGELFATRQMTRVIRELGRRFADRVVILDAAPCLSSSDPSMLAPTVGQILLVVEAERTQRPEVEAALDLIQSCPSIMLLLNKVQQVQRHGFGAYPSSYSYSAA